MGNLGSVATYAASMTVAGLSLTPVSQAQILVAFDDEFSTPHGLTLIVEPFGVLENDLLDDESAGESGATAELVEDAAHGTLSLSSDGSFAYLPDATFDGTDQFVYRAMFGAESSEATVVLSACDGGPDVFTCWKETAFLDLAAELGFGSFSEGFENDDVWGVTRSPGTALSVTSNGVRWMSNHPGAPAFNEITTGPGPAYSGNWGLYDSEHGYATGTFGECDVDDPPVHCLYQDGFTGVRVAGLDAFHGVGGYIRGTYPADVGIVIDGEPRVGGGRLSSGAHQFFGVIDARDAGFTQFEYRDYEGKIGQAVLLWGDEFTMLTGAAVGVGDPTSSLALPSATLRAGPNPGRRTQSLHVTLAQASAVELGIFDVVGRRVRRLSVGERAEGVHTVTWDGRDDRGVELSPGTFFARLVVEAGGRRRIIVKKMIRL